MRLLTYNIHKGIGGRDRRYRLARIIEVIEHEQPDLICLQEVDHDVRRSNHDDQPQVLAERFASAAAMFQMNVRLKNGGYGNMLLSRWPLASKHHISLALARKKPRGAQLAVVETPQGPLQLVNWHLGLAHRERQWQVEHLLRHRLYAQACHLPTVIAGDFNDWRNTLAGGLLAQHGLAQVTAPASKFHTFPAWLAVGSLDKAFCSRLITVTRAHVVRSLLARRASDHLPLVVEFEIVPKEA